MITLARLATWSLVAGLILLAAGLSIDNGMLWFQAHGVVMMVGGILSAIAAWNNASLQRFGRSIPRPLLERQSGWFLAAVVMLGLGTLLQPSNIFSFVALFGMLALIAASIVSLQIHRASSPEGSIVDVDRDPLTKGDDASLKHLKFAHFVFPVGAVMVMVPFLPYVLNQAWAQGLYIAGLHVIGLGYVLLSLYGIGHLWVPRFSGVPAIAAGAIKGELHSTLPALILMPIGFATDTVGLIIAGGGFAFLGFFTYMGVLGANIMKNKSTTHRVTPEFVYIPWTFTAIFWLVSGVVMGIFLNAVPDLLADQHEGLKATHVHVVLLGGVVQLLVGLATRFLPAEGEHGPPRFQGAMAGAFYAFNGAVTAIILNGFTGSNAWPVIAVALMAAAIAFWMRAMEAFIRAPPSATE